MLDTGKLKEKILSILKLIGFIILAASNVVLSLQVAELNESLEAINSKLAILEKAPPVEPVISSENGSNVSKYMGIVLLVTISSYCLVHYYLGSGNFSEDLVSLNQIICDYLKDPGRSSDFTNKVFSSNAKFELVHKPLSSEYNSSNDSALRATLYIWERRISTVGRFLYELVHPK